MTRIVPPQAQRVDLEHLRDEPGPGARRDAASLPQAGAARTSRTLRWSVRGRGVAPLALRWRQGVRLTVVRGRPLSCLPAPPRPRPARALRIGTVPPGEVESRRRDVLA